MKKIIIIAIALVSTSIAYAQNKQTNDKYAYSKEGISAENIQIRDKAIQDMKIEEQRQQIVHAQTTEFLANQAKEAQKPVATPATQQGSTIKERGSAPISESKPTVVSLPNEKAGGSGQMPAKASKVETTKTPVLNKQVDRKASK
jgi:hypothetical protein